MNLLRKNNLLWIASFLYVLIIFQIKYGLQVLLPTNISWLMTILDDWGQHYLGWLFYQNEPWHFPLGHIDKMYYPLGTNVGFTDSIPLLCLFFKLFAPLLPANFQFLGIWLFLCHLLAAYYTIRLLQLFKVSHLITFAAVVLVAANPVLIYRGMHPALCAHWMLIASFYLYFSDPRVVKVKRILTYQFILLMIAVLVNPYIGFMVLGLSVTLLVKIAFFDKAITRKRFAGSLAVALFSILLAWFLVGLIEFGKKEDLGVQGAYGLYGFNLNSLYNAKGYSTFLPDFKEVSWHQFESYMYLGLGVILLLFFLLFYALYEIALKRIVIRGGAAWRARLRLNNTSAIPLLVFVILVSVFAITNVVSINDKVLFRLPVPSILTKLGEVFRASCRFFWIPYYLILLFSIIAFAKLKINSLGKTAMIILVVLIQLIDIRPILNPRKMTYGAYYPPLDKNWTRLMAPFDNIVFYPPFESQQLTQMDYEYFCFLAARSRKGINIGYVARADHGAMKLYSDSLSSSLENGMPLRPKTLYITTQPYLDHFSLLLQSGGASLNTVDGYYYLYSDGIRNDSLRSLSTALNDKNKPKLDSGLRITSTKVEFSETGKLPVTENKPLRYFIQRLDNGEKFIAAEGWGFIDSTFNNKGDSIFITLSSDTKTYIAATTLQPRPDVTIHFSKPYLDDAGFKILAFFDSVPKGIYRLGIAVRDQQGRLVCQPDDNMVGVGVPKYTPPEKLVKLPPEGKIVHAFDFVSSDGSLVSISGWAVLDQQDADGCLITCLLKSKDNTYALETEMVERPDVTAAFKNRFKLDNAGFKAKVSKNMLPKGRYQIGILIKDTKHSKENVIFTDKTVDIP
jgi:hypothetical protein